MKLRALELVRFGAMQDKVLRLDPERPFHVAYAPNEAGKSTMRRGLLALLFGIGGQDPDAAVFQSDTKVAGQFETSEGLVRLTRHKRIKAPLVTDEAGSDWGASLEQLQLGRSREAYARGFALDHLGLRAFAHALAHEGPLAALAAAELGGLDVGAMQRALDDAATKLATDVATRSKKKEIALAIEEMRRLDAELLDAVVSPTRVANIRQTCADAEALLAALRTDERALDHAVWRAEQRAQLSVEAQELELHVGKLQAMAPARSLTEEELADARAHASRVERARDALERISAEHTQLDARIRSLPTHDVSLAATAREIAHRHVEIDALMQSAEALSEVQIALREAHAAESALGVEQKGLGLQGPLPLTEGWLQLVARWREAAVQLERHRRELGARPEAQRTYTEGDLACLETALACAELAAAAQVVNALVERLERAEREHDELFQLTSTTTLPVDLLAMRRARDTAILAHLAENRAAEPQTLRAWLQDAAAVDLVSDGLLSQATSGAHHAEALRAATSSRDHLRADMAQARAQADTTIKQLQETLRALSVNPPSEATAVLQKGREAADRLRRAIAKSHEDTRRLELWRQRDAELADVLAECDDEAHAMWGVTLGARLHGVAERVFATSEKSVHTACECARLQDAERIAHAALAARTTGLPVPQTTAYQEGKTYQKQLADLRLRSAAQLAEALFYEQALQARAALEKSRATAEESLVASQATLAQCLQAIGGAHIQALEEARLQTRLYEDAQAQVHQRQAAIAAGAARIGLEFADALVPSNLANESLQNTRARRDEAHAVVQAADLRQQAALRELHLLQGHGTRAIELSDERSSIAAHLEELLGRYVRLRSASILLSHALREHRDAQLAPLLRCTSGYMNALTGGAYDTVILDADQDAPELQLHARNGRPRSVHELSDGTRDQLGLATRLAYEELHASKDALPLLLDDILVHFDDERAAHALRALSAFCTQRPVLLLTHHAHVLELARAHVPAELLDVTTLAATTPT